MQIKSLLSILLLLSVLFLAAPAPAMAQAAQIKAFNDSAWYCPPPRFQIFNAPKPYGGLMMIDTQTGQSWQRIKVNTPKGIRVRWLKVPMVDEIPDGQTILWD